MPLATSGATVLASSTKAAPIWEEISPRWLFKLLPWTQVKAGIFRINEVIKPIEVVGDHPEGAQLPDSWAEYEANPKEIILSTLQTVVQIHTRVPDLFNSPHDQLREQIRLAIEAIKEEKERLIINSPTVGLLTVAAEKMRLQGGGEPPSPDHLDDLISLVWKKPAFFLAHPRAIAAFGHQCTKNGLTLETVEMYGVPFVAWRGIPLIPSDKLPVSQGESRRGNTTSIILMRVGEQEQGVIGLHQEGVGDEHLPSINVRLMGIDQQSVSRYLVTAYFSVAVLAKDALGVVHDVVV